MQPMRAKMCQPPRLRTKVHTGRREFHSHWHRRLHQPPSSKPTNAPCFFSISKVLSRSHRNTAARRGGALATNGKTRQKRPLAASLCECRHHSLMFIFSAILKSVVSHRRSAMVVVAIGIIGFPFGGHVRSPYRKE
ncbi:hypothetical protein PIB30_069912 [Stylosanthes scabra]|uniref:Uncharacterized protein n=1 Tax=Stylosanthes scabra TaxID=79078 RepID=A0ABU6XPN0_9FABA|nr:hypothetical protein [Stylosanthes scabra]